MRACWIVLLAGCWSSSSPSSPADTKPAGPPPPACDVLLARFKEVQIEIALDGDPDPEARASLEAKSDSWMPSSAECAGWSPAFKRCLYAAKTEADNFVCSREQQIENGVDMGGPTCEGVVAHMMSFLLGASDPAIANIARTRLMNGCVAMPRKMKECTLTADGFETYITCADPKDRARVGRALSGS